MMAATLVIPWLFASVTPPSEVVSPDRPYGKVMGDGLGLEIALPPQNGGVCAPGETVFGIDVSYYQGNIDWNAVAADGVKFAIVRVSHSLQFFDPEFEDNLAGARAAGIHTGVYQYFEPDEDPVAQADLLLEALGPLQPGDLPPMIDVESTAGLGPAAITNAIHAWIDRVESQLGVKPLVYSGYYFWNDNVGSADFGAYPLMLPWYGVECPGGVPTGWDMWTIHQYCDCGGVAGISGNVDVDRFNGSLTDLEALSFGQVCGDGTCSGGESPYTCAEDCPPCGVIDAAGGMVDDGDACYFAFGNAEYWRPEAQGEGGSSVWTHATDYDVPYNYAIWQLHFAESGRYEIEAHVVQPFGQSKLAKYQVRHADGDAAVMVDQSASSGWVSLGEFQFTADTDHSVRLDDNTGESPDANVQLVYDAVRVTRVDLDPSDTGEPGESESNGGESDEGGNGEAGTDGGDETDPSDTSSGIDPTGSLDDDPKGCGCRSDGRSGAAWLVLLGGLALQRSRRRRV